VRAGRGVSARAIKDKARTKTLAFGGLTALGFGVLQSQVKLPNITGVPNSLTYGAGALAVGLMAGSDVLVNMALGPTFAGLHNIGLNGLGGTSIAGVDSVAGSSSVFPEIAGDFEDLRV
jgi:hypothetical protein